MARHRSINPASLLHTAIPADARKLMDNYLYSDLEGRVPKGAYGEFLAARIREFFTYRRLDLSPYGYPQGYFVQAPKEMIELVEQAMQLKGDLL